MFWALFGASAGPARRPAARAPCGLGLASLASPIPFSLATAAAAARCAELVRQDVIALAGLTKDSCSGVRVATAGL